MVDVSVRQDDMVYLLRIDHDVAVHGISLKTFPLKHSTIEKYFLTFICSNQMFASCDLARRADKLYFHDIILFNINFPCDISVFSQNIDEINSASE